MRQSPSPPPLLLRLQDDCLRNVMEFLSADEEYAKWRLSVNQQMCMRVGVVRGRLPLIELLCDSVQVRTAFLPLLRRHKTSVCYLFVTLNSCTGLHWARENGFNFSRDTCQYAASRKNVHLLRYLSKWRFRPCLDALRDGPEEVLQWAVTEGFPWDVDNEVEMLFSARV
jgi:hypothetical protein